ncbi:uncharacterized protein DMENIID0001_139280 [Sergentomyia squamirostris]
MSAEDDAGTSGQNCNPSCDDFEIDEKLKGDRIGNSLYSERFVLSTLIALTKMDLSESLSEDFEKDLCILWDMTIEKDVIRLLLTHNVLELFTQIIQGTEDERLIEILVGIIGNMCSLAETRDQLCENSNVVESVLELIGSFDPPTLLQLMRLLHACLVFENTGDESMWFEHISSVDGFVEKFANILANSVNRSLLSTAFEALNAMVSKFAMVLEFQHEDSAQVKDTLLNPLLINGIIEAYRQLTPDVQNSSTTEELDLTEKKKKIVSHFLEINIILSQYGDASKECYAPCLQNLHECLDNIISPYCHAVNLLPPTTNEQSVIENVTDLLLVLAIPFSAKTFTNMITIWSLIEKYRRESPEAGAEDFEWSSRHEKANCEDISQTLFDFFTRFTKTCSQEDFEKALETIPMNNLKGISEKCQENPEDFEKELSTKLKVFFAKLEGKKDE